MEWLRRQSSLTKILLTIIFMRIFWQKVAKILLTDFQRSAYVCGVSWLGMFFFQRTEKKGAASQTSEPPAAIPAMRRWDFWVFFTAAPVQKSEFTKVLMNGLWRPGSTLLFDEPQAVKTENVIHRFKGLLAPLSSSSASSCDNEVSKCSLETILLSHTFFFLKPIRASFFKRKKIYLWFSPHSIVL